MKYSRSIKLHKIPNGTEVHDLSKCTHIPPCPGSHMPLPVCNWYISVCALLCLLAGGSGELSERAQKVKLINKSANSGRSSRFLKHRGQWTQKMTHAMLGCIQRWHQLCHCCGYEKYGLLTLRDFQLNLPAVIETVFLKMTGRANIQVHVNPPWSDACKSASMWVINAYNDVKNCLQQNAYAT